VSVSEVDAALLVGGEDDMRAAAAIDAACRDTGFFTLVNHGVDRALRTRLVGLAREFFALDDADKSEIGMARGGRAWRGWFPVGGELTSGIPDVKEGIYYGEELGADDPRVRAGVPLHGANLFPQQPVALRATVLEYMHALTELSHIVMRGVALGLGLRGDWFARELTGSPTVMFRVFHYPPVPRSSSRPTDDDQWGVREHTDYGLLTVLMQDATAGLQVRSRSDWIDVPADPDAFVCNIGDMLERMTGGRYRSTPHRVRNPSDTGRLSFPFFFDPDWNATVRRVPGLGAEDVADDAGRWDGMNVHDGDGTYGEYLLAKVAKVFPVLRDDVLSEGDDEP
jgi:isopenicillin N synthase-like dioxygenase